MSSVFTAFPFTRLWKGGTKTRRALWNRVRLKSPNSFSEMSYTVYWRNLVCLAMFGLEFPESWQQVHLSKKNWLWGYESKPRHPKYPSNSWWILLNSWLFPQSYDNNRFRNRPGSFSFSMAGRSLSHGPWQVASWRGASVDSLWSCCCSSARCFCCTLWPQMLEQNITKRPSWCHPSWEPWPNCYGPSPNP
jgi:hypothetical protein